MSRSGYNDDCWGWELIQWRGRVTAALRGKRGQDFLQEMLEAMASLPERKLIADDLERDGCVCAIGAVGKARGIDMTGIDIEERSQVAQAFGIAEALAAEIVFMNDEWQYWRAGVETPEQRFERMRKWIESELYEGPALPSHERQTP